MCCSVVSETLLIGAVLTAGKGDYGDIMLARVDAGPDAGQHQHQSLVVVKTLLSTAAHHQRELQHEAEMFSRACHLTDCHVVRLLGVCSSLQPPLIVTEYCELVCSLYLRSLVHSDFCQCSGTEHTGQLLQVNI